MNILNEVINRSYPNAALSCRECGRGGKDILAREDSQVSAENPLGERRLEISCAGCWLTDHAIEPENVRSTVKAWLLQEETRYMCSFEFFFNGTQPSKELTEIPSLDAVAGGFWVNEELKFACPTQAPLECVYWVPPSNIYSIKKDISVRRLSE